jgi:hypothetical protein
MKAPERRDTDCQAHILVEWYFQNALRVHPDQHPPLTTSNNKHMKKEVGSAWRGIFCFIHLTEHKFGN